WLKIIKSTRARSKINQWLKVEERARSLALGRELFEREARKYRLSPTALLGGDAVKQAAADAGFPGVDDLLASIGYGKTSVHQVLGRLAPAPLPEAGTEPRPRPGARPRTESGVKIRGVDDLLTERQHHEGRGHRHRGQARAEPLRGRGGRPAPAPGDHGRHPRHPRRHERRARPGPRVRRRRFEALVERALETLPARFKRK